ncbi:glycosyltransferase [Lacticaseibacillus paracasei]|uniref:Glycosyltransferase n=1 Tax=Lacticaseibacillus paracasei subsp. paracasei CNCM I-4270 TaxID=1256202 RepID=A0A8E0INA6_LACPA|nr:glycosyltransferase [Lacticaseibacillus paracasei]EPC17560.1 glycosyl transferase, group 2 family protein [Lacticaseibacillus paracasei subsp. paracasei Lpp230]EPC56862.1 glycosyltransferase [Lacticaseibacillus paracasei subsp. paracasei CNCM I-4270]MCT3362565.1 glycosyltransferase [Lacticaseibacillus paracasei]UNG76996.1 glycosyltransferase [Lacticaseibacillus paracasei]
MLQIGVVVVSYNPDLNVLRNNLRTLKTHENVDCLIVDNGSQNSHELKKVGIDLQVDVLLLKKNFGIAYAQNRGFEFFKDREVDWVLTLDQDSLIPSNLVDVYTNSVQLSFPDSAILTCSYVDDEWTEIQKRAMMQADKVVQKKYVISSGNLIRVSAWEKVGGFDEFLFIDLVDFDFDAKLFLAGYKIWETNEVILHHSVGKTLNKPIMQKLLLLPEDAILADHSPMRQYYIYRNSIIFEKRYTMISKRRFVVLHTFFATRRVFAYRQKLRKLIAAWRGVIDGALYRAGRDAEFQQKLIKLRH